MKRKLSLLLVFAMILSMATSVFTYAEMEFTVLDMSALEKEEVKTETEEVEKITDIDYKKHWAREIISKWVAAGKVKGYEDGSFKPDNLMTRAEFATLLASCIDIQIAEPSEHEFNDVKKDDWYYDSIKKLVTLTVVAPGENFMPQSYISRQDVMTMAGRAFYYMSEDEKILDTFTDKLDVSDYAKIYVSALIESGFVSGYEDGTLKPLKNITRAECVKILDGFNIVKDPYTLEGIMQRIYDNLTEKVGNTMTMEITKENSEYYLGIPEMEFEEALACEPMIGSIAHSVCLVRVKDGTDIEKTMKDIKDSVNPRKWICVGVDREDVLVANKDGIIIMVIDQTAPKQYLDSFMSLDVKKNEIIEADDNGLITYNGYYMDFIGEMRPMGVKATAEKIEYLASKYATLYNTVLYSVIPSKSYFINDKLKTPFDYGRMKELLLENVKKAKYFDVFDTVTLDDYYLTDPHIKQDRLYNLVKAALPGIFLDGELEKNNLITINGFIGQHKAKAPDIKAESIQYVTNKYIENAVVTNIMGDKYDKVYNEEKLSSASPYDFFLSGPAPIKKIVNHDVPQEKKLVIFGDSFSCSVAPLLIEKYHEISIIDLRYVASSLIENYVQITDSTDILFLFNEQVVNNGEMLKVIFE